MTLTSELSERRVRLEVKTFPVLIERLQAELTRLLDGSDSHSSHHSRHIMAPADLQRVTDCNNRTNPMHAEFTENGTLPGQQLAEKKRSPFFQRRSA